MPVFRHTKVHLPVGAAKSRLECMNYLLYRTERIGSHV